MGKLTHNQRLARCALLGLAKNRKRAPQFKVLRARVSMDFKLARQKLESARVSAGWKEQLESEYAQFVETVKQWQQLQMDRMQQGRQKLADRIETETSSLTASYRELENSLKMQHKRLALLTAQVM